MLLLVVLNKIIYDETVVGKWRVVLQNTVMAITKTHLYFQKISLTLLVILFCLFQGYVAVTGIHDYSDSAVLFLDCPNDKDLLRYLPPCKDRSKYKRVDNKRIVIVPYQNITDNKVYITMRYFGLIQKAIKLTLKASIQLPNYGEEVDQ